MIIDKKIQASTDKIYELFANLFAKEPTEELLYLLQQKKNEIFESYGINPLSDIKNLSFKKQKELLAAEYTRLFLTPPRMILLYESLQLGEGRLWGNRSVEVNKIYKKFGFELDENFKETPDHLSAELSFLAQLSKLESEYINGGLIQAHKGVLEVKRYFLKNHLLKWVSHIKDEITKHTKLSYYRGIAQFLNTFLNEEYENLKEIKDIS